MRFKVGDKVRVRKDLKIGCVYGNQTFVDGMEMYLGKKVLISRMKGEDYKISTSTWSWTDEMFEHSIKGNPGDIFSILNYQDAKDFIGCTVEACDNGEFFSNEWQDIILIGLSKEQYPFDDDKGNDWELIRLTEKTFKTGPFTPKPDKAGLIKTLKLSIFQWELMLQTGKSKPVCYEFLGGKLDNSRYCLLCDFVLGDKTCNPDCINCINWGGGDDCTTSITVYSTWERNRTYKNCQAVIDHMKSELKRLENETK